MFAATGLVWLLRQEASWLSLALKKKNDFIASSELPLQTPGDQLSLQTMASLPLRTLISPKKSNPNSVSHPQVMVLKLKVPGTAYLNKHPPVSTAVFDWCPGPTQQHRKACRQGGWHMGIQEGQVQPPGSQQLRLDRAQSCSRGVGARHKAEWTMSPKARLTVHKGLAFFLELYGLLGNLRVQHPQLVQLIKVQPGFSQDVLGHGCKESSPRPRSLPSPSKRSQLPTQPHSWPRTPRPKAQMFQKLPLPSASASLSLTCLPSSFLPREERF